MGAFAKQFDLSGKVALVTGGSKGLGKAMARAFAEAGADILIASRSADELRSAVADISQGLDRRVEFLAGDMTVREDVEGLAKAALAAFGRVDVLVNNAGTSMPQAIEDLTDETWDAVLQLNLTTAVALSRALIPQMRAQRWGRIINISSIFGTSGFEKRVSYSAAKAGLIGMTRSLALDVGRFGITVNCLAPGPFLTELTQRNFTTEQREKISGRLALGRWAAVEEIGGPALLLASDAGSFITGATIAVDGGAVKVG